MKIMGDRACGKTTLLSYLDGRLKTDRYVPTLGVDFVSYTNSGMTLHVWDTSGSNRFSAVIRPFIRDASLILIVYNSEKSFKKVPMYIEWVKTICNRDYRILLISLASDLHLECQGQFLAQEENINFMQCNSFDRASSLAFWHELMHFCLTEISKNSWKVNDMEKASHTIETVPPQRNYYRLCWWF